MQQFCISSLDLRDGEIIQHLIDQLAIARKILKKNRVKNIKVKLAYQTKEGMIDEKFVVPNDLKLFVIGEE